MKKLILLVLMVFALMASGLRAVASPPTWAPVPVCGPAPHGQVRCHAVVRVAAKRIRTNVIGGLSPATIKTAYNFPTSSTVGSGETIAIVDAYDDPNAANDLNVFSKQWGLPRCGNGCFTKVGQTGGSSLPSADSRWALEISLDIEWAHAIAPGASILLVETNSSNLSDMVVGESYANSHAQYVSNSWGGGEFSGESSYDQYFGQGVSTFVAAGDSGLPAGYPSASPNVISVGGTSLGENSSGWLDYAWPNSGGGCSAYETAAPAQQSFSQYGQANCNGYRATPDLSLDADPQSGVAVYDSTSYNGTTGWFEVGGTSASTPMVAARAADTGQRVDAAYIYGSSITYRDVTRGAWGSTNGAPCLVGYDMCSGRGAWVG